MKKILLKSILLISLTGCNNSPTKENSTSQKLLNIDPVECAYFIKPNKEYPHGDMLPFDNCGKIIDGKLELKTEHLHNMSFKSDESLTTVYTTKGEVFYVNKQGKTQRMYFFDMGADYFQEGLARYLNKNNQIGFVNSKLAFVIPARYDYATSFQDGVAIVSNGSHSEKASDHEEEEHRYMVGGVWGAIDKKGKMIVEMRYGSEGEVREFLKKRKD